MSLSALIAAMLLATAPAHAREQSSTSPTPPSTVDAAAAPAVPPALPIAATPQAEIAPSASDQPLPAPVASTEPHDADPDEDDYIVTGRRGAPPGDPLEKVNVETYKAVQVVDRAVIAPAAQGYKKALPEPIRAGVRNFFNNLTEPVVFLNYMLQLKPGKAFETVGRFAINSTAGVAGLFDIAKRRPFKLPLRRNGFANTLGYYGVGNGPFLFLPLVGPTTVRDLIGLGLDKALLPFTVGAPFGQPYYTIPSSAVTSLDYRVEFDAQLREQSQAPDPYAASRENYLRNRQAEIDALHGRKPRPPASDADDIGTDTGPLVGPVIPPAAKATAPEVTPPAGAGETPARPVPETAPAPVPATGGVLVPAN